MTETAALVALPPQPRDVPWPTQQWPRGEPHVRDATAFAAACNAVFELTPAQGVTYALLVVQAGCLVYERYAAGAANFYLQYSWSMAKSITHALVGIAQRRHALELDAPADVPEWRDAADPRREITLDQLLTMRSGLEFNEDYVDDSVSDVIEMLNFSGRRDMGGYAAAKPLVHPPGANFSYASGTTNIVCRLLRDRIGGATEMLAFMRDELFEPIGMHTPLPKFDHAGTFVGSSYCLATPQDFARFGYLYLRDGVWDGRRILPDGWVDHARRASYVDAAQGYGAHWWLQPGTSRFYAGGYDGQRIIVAPEQDLVVVRCGRTPVGEMPHVTAQLDTLMRALV